MPTIDAPAAAPRVDAARLPTDPAPDPASLAPARAIGRAAVPLALAATLAACGGGGDESASGGLPDPPYEIPGPDTDTEADRFLQQAQFSSSEAEIAAVRTRGYARWLEEQMSAPRSGRGWDWLVQGGYQNVDIRFNNYADRMLWHQLITARDAVRKRLALAWSEILVVSSNGIDGYWPSFAMAAYWDLLNQHAFGNFRELLEAITLNPAMGAYLNTLGNRKANSAGRVPDENYAREVMQLFTIGPVRAERRRQPAWRAGHRNLRHRRRQQPGLHLHRLRARQERQRTHHQSCPLRQADALQRGTARQ